MLDLKRWERAEYTTGDHAITMELKRLQRSEARALQRALMRVFQDTPSGDPTPAQVGEMMDRLDQAMPEDQLRKWFEGYVRNVGGLTIDGEPVTTGAALFEVADDGLTSFVLNTLYSRSQLTVTEAKTSASPSTSRVGSEASPSASCAPSTGTEPSNSTAPEPTVT